MLFRRHERGIPSSRKARAGRGLRGGGAYRIASPASSAFSSASKHVLPLASSSFSPPSWCVRLTLPHHGKSIRSHRLGGSSLRPEVFASLPAPRAASRCAILFRGFWRRSFSLTTAPVDGPCGKLASIAHPGRGGKRWHCRRWHCRVRGGCSVLQATAQVNMPRLPVTLLPEQTEFWGRE